MRVDTDKDREAFREIRANAVYCVFANKFWFSRKQRRGESRVVSNIRLYLDLDV